MHEIFPKMTKCDFFTHSSVGQVDVSEMDKKSDWSVMIWCLPQKFDAMCLLPLNIVNEKVFLVLWFWFILLTTCSALALVYRYFQKWKLFGIRQGSSSQYQSSYLDFAVWYCFWIETAMSSVGITATKSVIITDCRGWFLHRPMPLAIFRIFAIMQDLNDFGCRTFECSCWIMTLTMYILNNLDNAGCP